MNKIYLIAGGEYSDYHIAAVFKNKEKAEFYADIRNKLNPYNGYYVVEREFHDDNVTMTEKVVTYYCACIDLEDGEIYYEEDETEIYTKDVIIEKEDDYISVSSTKSLDHAKKVAIEQYQIYTQQLLEDGVDLETRIREHQQRQFEKDQERKRAKEEWERCLDEERRQKEEAKQRSLDIFKSVLVKDK